jgi:hypothetical protein
MIETSRFAGFVASHAIYLVSQGNSLTVPLLVLEKAKGNPQFIQVTGTSSQEAVARAGRLLERPAKGVVRAVMVFEAYLNLPPGKTDAIFLQACQYRPKEQQLQVAVPFRLPTSPDGFAVFRPKFIAYEDEVPSADLLAAFLKGTSLHPAGHAVWVRHLAESR